MKHLSSLLLGFALLGGSGAIATEVQHLTCVKDPQGLMCKVEETQQAVILKTPTHSSSDLAPSVQLQFLCDVMIGLMFIGLPIALITSVLIHDKRDAERTKQVEQLERIWQQS